jgi:probable F420-dependent oxidoreductase
MDGSREAAMKYGACIFPTEYSITPADLGIALEERGFESLWVAEHSHIPVSRKSPWPGGPELPKMYYDVMDPFVALAMAAAVTTELRLATGICLVVQRDPIQTAKEVASLDVLSNGRFLFGIGGGWNLEEIADHGTDPSRRWKLLRERVEAMKALWTQEKAEYHGELVDFEPAYAWPKPRQKPHPPVIIGGAAPHAIRRAVRYCDGWIPLLGRGDDDMAKHVATLRRAAEEAGRDPESIEVSIYGCPPDRARIDELRDAGVSRVIFFLMPQSRDELLPVLDEQAGLID